MKINRRGFLSLGLGASVGLTLSPLPWKLLDDVSIWTQNWPWVPVPADGKVSHVDSVCTLCPGNCGITARKVDERVVSVAGRTDKSDGSRGGICPLGLSGPQLLYTPVRVMSPMLRGEVGFQAISWEKAHAILQSKLVQLRDAGKQDRLASITGSEVSITQALFKRFLNAFGSGQTYHIAAADDSWEAVSEKLAGRGVVPGYDLEAADVILSLGCSFAEGWGNPVRSIAAMSRWKDKGATLVQVEPRLSNTAALADQWIACKPGAEADLAFGICLAMIERNPACRQRLIETVTHPEEVLNSLGSRYSPEQVENATGIKGSVIISLADRFAGAAHPLAVCGKGDGRTAVDSREIASILLLNMVAGNINRTGGLHLISRRDYTELSGSGSPASGFQSENRFRMAVSDSSSPIDVLLVSGANPCYTLKDSQRVNEGIERIPFVVSLATHWDETAMRADLVLPMDSHLEGYRDTAVYGGSVVPRLGLSKPVSRRLFDTRSAADVLIETARLLGGSVARMFPWRSYETCFREKLGERLPALRRNGHVDLQHERVAAIPKLDLTAIIREQEPLVRDETEYPLILISKTSLRLSSGVIGSSPFMVKTVPESVLTSKMGVIDINPVTAMEQGVSAGDTVQLRTPRGEAIVRVHPDDGTMPGLLVMSAGLGHSAYNDYLAGKGEPVNRLLSSEADTLTGHDIAWGAGAVLKKI